MKKRYKIKKRKRIFKKVITLILIFLCSFFFCFKIINIKINRNDLLKTFLSSNNPTIEKDLNKKNIFEKVLYYLNNIDINNKESYIENNYKFKNNSDNASDNLVSNQNTTHINPIVLNDIESDPIVYIYNTHQTEEYNYVANDTYNIKPNVTVNNYILKEQLNEYGINSYIEENNVMDILNANNWNYASSYKVSRMFMENAKNKYPSLKYFIDLHRDSVSKKISTTEIDGKSYARVLFIVGLENSNYVQNLEFTNKINERINSLYPNLSRGIYKKQGKGVNGIYNQDFSNRVILIEIGGEENTIDEVNNTMIAISKIIAQIIGEDNE